MKHQAHIAGALYDFAQRGTWKKASERVKALAKIHVTDGLAAMLAGGPSTPRAVETFFGGQFGADTCARAAYTYAFAGRVSNCDDVLTTEKSTYGLLGHPTIPALASALAVGRAKAAPGELVLDAYLAGAEASARLAAATPPMNLANRFSATTTFGGIGALLAAARLLNLDRKQFLAAFDAWQLVVPMSPLDYDSPVNVACRDAHSVRAAVECALDAQRGERVDPTFFGPLSMLDPNAAMSLGRRLGAPFCIEEPGFAIRVYPAEPLTHTAIDATLAIVNVHGIEAAEIERIDVGITRMMADRLLLQPPSAVAELHRCVPFVVALAAIRGVVEVEDFNQMPADAALAGMMGRVHPVVDAELDSLGYERARCWVRILLKDGRGVGLPVEVAKGTPQKPLSELELAHKFLRCASPMLDQEGAEILLNRLWELDSVPDVNAIFLVPQERLQRTGLATESRSVLTVN
jgi:2-methylcitrate dehydratase PrpD